MAVASCSELTNDTLLRSILFGHKAEGASPTPARTGPAGRRRRPRLLLLDDFHRLPDGGSAILHSFLEDGEYSPLGEESRRHAEAAAVLTVETALARTQASASSPGVLARVERLPLRPPAPPRTPDDIEAQAAG
jgi:transcriptional regulator with AAA-type ATPase domain